THDLVTVSANIDGGMPWRRTWGNNVVYTDWRRDNYYHAISEILRSQSVTPRRIGIEADFMSLATREQFVSTFPDAELVDVSQATMRQRMLKSDEEINVIKHGARIADLGGNAVVEAIGEGVPEYEVALAGTDAMVREIAKTFPHCELRDTWVRSEEHTSELQSRFELVCRLLLEKKNRPARAGTGV